MYRIEKLVAAAITGTWVSFLSLKALVVVGLAFILCDVYTAWDLSKRLKRRGKPSSGKFKTDPAKRVIRTMIDFFMCVILAYALEKHVLLMFDSLYLANWVTAIFCVLQFISMLENISSCNDAVWAKVLQRVLIDKSKRHYDIDVDIKNYKNEENDNL